MGRKGKKLHNNRMVFSIVLLLAVISVFGMTVRLSGLIEPSLAQRYPIENGELMQQRSLQQIEKLKKETVTSGRQQSYHGKPSISPELSQPNQLPSQFEAPQQLRFEGQDNLLQNTYPIITDKGILKHPNPHKANIGRQSKDGESKQKEDQLGTTDSGLLPFDNPPGFLLNTDDFNASKRLLSGFVFPLPPFDTAQKRKHLLKEYRGACGPDNINITGANATCSDLPKTATAIKIPLYRDGVVDVACRSIEYKAPKERIANATTSQLIVGIASNSKSRDRRDSIRRTWARFLPPKNVYFVVGGPWEEVRKEYHFYRDLIWVDFPEDFNHLTYKTGVMVDAFRKWIPDLQYMLKTDDDIYWNIHELHKLFLPNRDAYGQDYFGSCHLMRSYPFRPFQIKDLENYTKKYVVNKVTYPERCFPAYCFGWGYVMSKRLVNCVSENIGRMRFNPFEDVTIGLLASKCGGFEAHSFFQKDQWQHHWTDESWEVDLTGRVMQHPVKKPEEFEARHRSIRSW